MDFHAASMSVVGSKFNILKSRHKLRDLSFCRRKILHIGLNIKEMGFGCVAYWLRILARVGRYDTMLKF